MGTPTLLIVVCGSVSDPARLHEAAKPWILAGHRGYVPAANPLLSKEEHDADHRRWIDAADAVLVVRKPDGTVGASAGAERLYAAQRGVRELWWWPEGGQVPDPESVRVACRGPVLDVDPEATHQELVVCTRKPAPDVQGAVMRTGFDAWADNTARMAGGLGSPSRVWTRTAWADHWRPWQTRGGGR